ncbi:unnamed protein product [Sphenostylis stenocarpa]|uniref:Uncharacterized protein n=1 Tax=Sphenostylis stenocarpa TaxID=92480 RepID=A0AA86W1B6_9FABA|nr:unnamed protein product [Sphenostylis stenocarpa]
MLWQIINVFRSVQCDVDPAGLTMSKAFSSKKSSSFVPPPTPITVASPSCATKKRSPRSPLQDLNRISSSSNSSYASSSVSTEAPKGCLRFLSSSSFRTPAHRPKNLTKTPSSAPHAAALKQSKSNFSKENIPKGNAGLKSKTLGLDKARNHRKKPPCIYQWQSGKKSSSRTAQNQMSKPCSTFNDHGKVLPRLPSASDESKEKENILGGRDDTAGEHAHVKLCHGESNLSPSCKKATGSYLDDVRAFGDAEENPNASINRTPPIHNSVSPEIQCGSSLVSKTVTPACYGAGYVVSGVADKRKCRPRGILTVEKNYSGSEKRASSSFDDDEKIVMDTISHASPSLLPLPAEAVVHWLSSPCNKGRKIMSQKFENGLDKSQGLASSTTLSSGTSPSSSSKTFWNVSDSSDLSGGANGIMRKISSISPNGLAKFQVPSDYILSPSYSSLLFSPNPTPICRAGISGKGKCDRYNLIDENSPFSLNSFGSGNVIQTPQSDSSSELHVGLSLVHADNRKEVNSNPGLNSSSNILLSENFLLNSSMPPEESVNSSFQFECLTMPCESIDLSKLPKFLDEDPWLSSSTTENASQSQMRISWREGSTSQPYELDEFDCCRCLSDEEENVNDSGISKFSGPQVIVETNDGKELSSDIAITKTEDNEQEIDGLGKEKIPVLMSCSGAESQSIDGGGLVASGDDLDWASRRVN